MSNVLSRSIAGLYWNMLFDSILSNVLMIVMPVLMMAAMIRNFLVSCKCL